MVIHSLLRPLNALERTLDRFRPAIDESFSSPLMRSPILSPVTSLAYQWYSSQLTAEVKSKTLPQHIALIADGNRRFARSMGLSEVAGGHRHGTEKVNQVVEWCDELAIPVVTLWILSTDNLDRSQDEVDGLFSILRERLSSLWKDQEHSPIKRRVNVVGSLDLLPDDLREQVEETRQRTAEYGPHRLNVAIAYGGRDEILEAVQRMIRSRAANGETAEEIAEQLSSQDLQQYLYAPDVPEPDLIVRTSGEIRLGGFLLWQSVYSELYFCDAPWPAFRKIDFLRAIRSYQARQRRHGR